MQQLLQAPKLYRAGTWSTIGRKKSLLLLTLFLGGFSLGLSQPQEIELPSGSATMDIPKEADTYSFYITENHELYFGDTQLHYWDQVENSLRENDRTLGAFVVKDVIVYADKKVPHRLVQRLRSEIGKAFQRHIHYKGVDITSEKGVSLFVVGSEQKYRKIEDFGDFMFNRNRIYTLQEIEGTQQIMELGPPSLPPVAAIWQHNFALDLYNPDSTNIMSVLNSPNFTYRKIKVLPRSQFSLDGKRYDLKNNDAWSDIIKEADLLLIKFDFTLDYEAYFEALNAFQRFRSYDRSSIHGPLKKPYMLEVTYELEVLLKDANIDLFGD
ncbi:MAG: hypothetical protein AAGA86_15670 [Bacteroidota bacterium]